MQKLFTLILGFTLLFPSYSLPTSKTVRGDGVVTIVRGMPLDLLLHSHVGIAQELLKIEDQKSDQANALRAEIKQSRIDLLKNLWNTQSLSDLLDELKGADQVYLLGVQDLLNELQKKIKHNQLHEDGILLPRGIEELENYIQESTLASYQYAYGKELGRETIKEFEAIHRSTFMENKSHSVDIGIDFLAPIKKIIKALKLEKKFSFIYNSSLFWGYKSSFKHYKKVFMRFKGYYGKIQVKVELLRRKVHWWGYGDWEVTGYTYRNVEEPIAKVGTEVKELD